MQHAHVGGWAREAYVPAEIQNSVRDLNHRFLDLLAERQGGWNMPGRGLSLPARIAPLSAAQKSAAADCPYALFDLRFHDDGHWRTRLRDPAPGGSVAEGAAVDGKTLEFARLALFFAWHVASTTKLAPQLLLGMHEATAAAFREATIDRLPSLAATEAAHLTARWNDCTPYWSALTGAASGGDRASLRRIQLYGLQLAAAARLGSTGPAEDPKPWEHRVQLRGVPREV
ncbi:MAG TPA: hypothetical protein VKP66_21575 [Steroidobacteraceae bacterium]|nr:hypothetical protein [Steroidobacteraceae bacterium]